MRETPKPYEVYRHFKGNLYQVLAIATDSEDGSRKVVYQALYEPFGIYVRDLEMFLSPVDRNKYPDVQQGNRFELITGKRVSVSMPKTGEQDSQGAREVTGNNGAMTEHDAVTTQLNMDRQMSAGRSSEMQSVENGKQNVSSEAANVSPEAENTEGMAELDPWLLKFLDADSYGEKLNILVAMHDRLDQDMINTMAMALDVEVAQGAIEERYEQLKNCLITFEKYECNRLR